MVGDSLTILDFYIMFGVVYSFILNEKNEMIKELKPLLEKHEVFHKYVVGLSEELKDHISSLPARPF